MTMSLIEGRGMNRLFVKSVMLRVKDVAGSPRCVSSWIPCGGRARIDSKLIKKDDVRDTTI